MKTISIEFSMKELNDIRTALWTYTDGLYDAYKEVLKKEILPSKKDDKECCMPVGNSLDMLRNFNNYRDLLDRIDEAENELMEE